MKKANQQLISSRNSARSQLLIHMLHRVSLIKNDLKAAFSRRCKYGTHCFLFTRIPTDKHTVIVQPKSYDAPHCLTKGINMIARYEGFSCLL